MLTLEPIGVVRSPVIEGRGDHRGDVVSELHLEPHLAAGLDGLLLKRPRTARRRWSLAVDLHVRRLKLQRVLRMT